MTKKKISIPIYEGKLLIFGVKNWKVLNKKYFSNDPLSPTCSAVCTTHKAKYIAAFKGKPTTQVMVHEAKHIVNLIFRDRGVLLDVNNDEHEAYFLDWVFSQIEKCFNFNK